MNDQDKAYIRELKGLLYMTDDVCYSIYLSIGERVRMKEIVILLESEIVDLEKDQELVRISDTYYSELFLGDLKGSSADLVGYH
jgi:hypothetical protein